MKLTIKIIAAHMLLLLFLSGCGTPLTDVPTSEEASYQEAYNEPDLPTTEDSTENIEFSTEDTEFSIEDTEFSTEDTEASMSKLLRTSILPVGTTMYVWGGGWNEEDTGSGIETVTIGLSPTWAEFAAMQSSGYDQRNTRYQIHNGLDCSGYIGWLVYNTFHTENGEPGYVCKATKMASTFSSYGWGSYIYAGDVSDFRPGDICSMKGHVWMCLGKCSDGSVLLVHSSPPGVRICGTELSDGSTSQAISLAENIMGTCYPDWYNRYPDCAVPYSYLSSSSKMRWNSSTLSDAETYQGMSADEIAETLFTAISTQDH